MSVPTFTMRQLLEAGVHYGHQTARWNPRMAEYIYGDRNGIHIEQCLNCRGVFLDFGELENITQLEARFVASPPPQPGYGYGPDWGHRGGKHYRRGGLGGLFFSS